MNNAIPSGSICPICAVSLTPGSLAWCDNHALCALCTKRDEAARLIALASLRTPQMQRHIRRLRHQAWFCPPFLLRAPAHHLYIAIRLAQSENFAQSLAKIASALTRRSLITGNPPDAPQT